MGIWSYGGKIIGKVEERDGKSWAVLYDCPECPCKKDEECWYKDALIIHETGQRLITCPEDGPETDKDYVTAELKDYEIEIAQIKGVLNKETGEWEFKLPDDGVWISNEYVCVDAQVYTIKYKTSKCHYKPPTPNDCTTVVNYTEPRADGSTVTYECATQGSFIFSYNRDLFGPHVDIGIGVPSESDCFEESVCPEVLVYTACFCYNPISDEYTSVDGPSGIVNKGQTMIFRITPPGPPWETSSIMIDCLTVHRDEGIYEIEEVDQEMSISSGESTTVSSLTEPTVE